jgi:hypothetical protein
VHQIRDGQQHEAGGCPERAEQQRDGLEQLDKGPARVGEHGEGGGECRGR